MKGDSGRRRRTASEGEDDLNLKRFKGAADAPADGQNCSDPGKAPLWAADSTDRVSSTTKNGSACSEGAFAQGRVPSPSVAEQSAAPRYGAHVKENGRSLASQGAADSTTALAHTPTPPPLKLAPSPFSTTSFPSLGQMPSLVPGAPAPKASPSPQPDREDASPSAYSKTAALVSPGPVTISWSHDSGPSVALSASVAFSPKAPSWGSQTEVRPSLPSAAMSHCYSCC